eukprot:COSAG04_NODE_2389_length_4219_cov_3.328883_5_plen_61_part_00
MTRLGPQLAPWSVETRRFMPPTSYGSSASPSGGAHGAEKRPSTKARSVAVPGIGAMAGWR